MNLAVNEWLPTAREEGERRCADEFTGELPIEFSPSRNDTEPLVTVPRVM